MLAPSEAAAPKNAQLSHIAILRGDAEIPVPASAHVEADRVVWPNPGGARVYPLHPGDVILMDERERITAVQSARGVDLVRFVPGTAFSLPSSDEVQGQPEGKETSVPLILGDRIRVRGSFEVDDVVPGGGHVSKSRATGARRRPRLPVAFLRARGVRGGHVAAGG